MSTIWLFTNHITATKTSEKKQTLFIQFHICLKTFWIQPIWAPRTHLHRFCGFPVNSPTLQHNESTSSEASSLTYVHTLHLHPNPHFFTRIYTRRYMLALFDSHAAVPWGGGGSLHCFPLANCLATQCVSLSLSLSTTHTMNSLARPLSSLLVRSSDYFHIYSIGSQGEDKASYHDSPYVAHLTLCDATLWFTVALAAAGGDKIPSPLLLLHLTLKTSIKLPQWSRLQWKLLRQPHARTSHLRKMKLTISWNPPLFPGELCYHTDQR